MKKLLILTSIVVTALAISSGFTSIASASQIDGSVIAGVSGGTRLPLPLSLHMNGSRWATFSDFTAHRLSVDFAVENNGSNDALDFKITDTANTEAVVTLNCVPGGTPDGCLGIPMSLGTILAGQQSRFTLQYFLPAGVSGFHSTLNGIAKDANGFVHIYPGDLADSAAPVITGTWPPGNIIFQPNEIDVGYYDPSPSSGINTAAVSVTLDGNLLGGCTITSSYVSCPVSGVMAAGPHAIGGSVADNAGNTTPVSASFILEDSAAPVITGTWPPGSNIFQPNEIDVGYYDPSPSSGINTAAVSMTLDGNPLGGCDITGNHISCPSSYDLAVGVHTIGGSVADNAGNTTPISAVFVMEDSAAPVITGIWPPGDNIFQPNEIDVGYYDPSPSSGINTAAVNVTLDGNPLGGCDITSTYISCPVSGEMAAGVHTIGGSVADNAGNTTPVSGSFILADTGAPVITGIWPTGDDVFQPDVIDVSYYDPSPASGINLASVMLSLDGTMFSMSGCSITSDHVSCPAPIDLPAGTHTIGGSVADNAGNTTLISGSFLTD